MTARAPVDAGFTLIEALVAMAVLAVAAIGLVRAAGGHVDAVAAMETRVAGGLAADNALAEARLGLTPAVSPLFGRDWRGVVATRASVDPDIAALTVSAISRGSTVTLRGFRDMAPTRDGAPASDATPARNAAPARDGAPASDGAPTGDAAPAGDGAAESDGAAASDAAVAGNAAPAGDAALASHAASARDGAAASDGAAAAGDR